MVYEQLIALIILKKYEFVVSKLGHFYFIYRYHLYLSLLNLLLLPLYLLFLKIFDAYFHIIFKFLSLHIVFVSNLRHTRVRAIVKAL